MCEERVSLLMTRLSAVVEALEDELESCARIRWPGRAAYVAGLSEARRSLVHAADRVTEAVVDHAPPAGKERA